MRIWDVSQASKLRFESGDEFVEKGGTVADFSDADAVSDIPQCLLAISNDGFGQMRGACRKVQDSVHGENVKSRGIDWWRRKRLEFRGGRIAVSRTSAKMKEPPEEAAS